ncbi:MAG: S41 family peptidase [Clostridia bacterium]|nr:S41 family peptidase [Clostridia bacterium]
MSFFSKKIAWSWMLLVVALTVLITFMCTYVSMRNVAHQQQNDAYEESYAAEDPTLTMVKQLFEMNYIGELPEIDDSLTLDGMIYAYVAATGDPYARYMNPEEYSAYISSMQGDLVGIGVQVIYDEVTGGIEIMLVMPDSPAEKLGLQTGDLIVGVEKLRCETDGYEALVNAIAGKEGTDVRLTIRRDGTELQMTATRARVKSLSVTYEMLSDEKTGLIRISEFNATTPPQFKAAVDALQAAGATRLIYDMRNNPGGQLDSVLSVLSYLLPKDSVLIRVADAQGGEVSYSDTEEVDHTVDLPMAVLINGNTASAAELFTSCLRDYEKVTIVGELSYGKGCMQYMYGLPNGGALSLTTRMYSPPSGINYDGIGITPDIEVSLSDEAAKLNPLKLTEENDDQLKAAIQAVADRGDK